MKGICASKPPIPMELMRECTEGRGGSWNDILDFDNGVSILIYGIVIYRCCTKGFCVLKRWLKKRWFLI
jgi:hypothetical protein